MTPHLTATPPAIEGGWYVVVVMAGWHRVAVLMAEAEADVLEMRGRWVDD